MGVQPRLAATGQVTASTLVLAPVALVVDQPWTLTPPSALAWGAVIGLAALSTALAYALFFRILATAGAINLVLVTFLIPLSAAGLGALFLGERLEPRYFLGLALIGAGLAAIDGRLIAFARSLSLARKKSEMKARQTESRRGVWSPSPREAKRNGER
jgi:drug/metabolite transporter (DMT)-like permease